MLLTEQQAGEVAQVSKWTIRRLIERGQLKATNYGTDAHKVYRIHPDDLRGVNVVEPAAPVERVRRRRHRQAPVAPAAEVWPPVAA